MAFDSQENQLELFDVAHQSAPRPHRETLGRFLLQVRYDQAVLATMAGLLGLTVIFACGVERGKQLLRAERVRLAREQSAATASPAPAAKPTQDAAAEPVAEPQRKDRPAVAPTTGQKIRTAIRVASAEPTAPSADAKSSKRYAIQVSTFTRAQSAKQEMERLRATGERAFLMIREGRTVVFVGPFPSKSHAAEKLAALRARYQDCFVKTL